MHLGKFPSIQENWGLAINGKDECARKESTEVNITASVDADINEANSI